MESLMEDVEVNMILEVTLKLCACVCVCVQGKIYSRYILNSFYFTQYFKDIVIAHSTTFKMQKNR